MSLAELFKLSLGKVNSLLYNGQQMWPLPIDEKHNFITDIKTQSLAPPTCIGSTQQVAMCSMTCPELPHLHFVATHKLGSMLISHVSEDDGMHFYVPRAGTSVLEGLRLSSSKVFQTKDQFFRIELSISLQDYNVSVIWVIYANDVIRN